MSMIFTVITYVVVGIRWKVAVHGRSRLQMPCTRCYMTGD